MAPLDRRQALRLGAALTLSPLGLATGAGASSGAPQTLPSAAGAAHTARSPAPAPRGSRTAGHAPRAARAAEPRSRSERALKKAVKLGMVAEGDTVGAKLALLAELGFDGVEVDGPATGGFDSAQILAASRATGLPIHGVVDSVHWGKPLSHPDPAVRAEGLEGLRTALRDAALYGASTVLLVPAVVSKEISYADAWERSTAEIEKALPLAEELGVKIAFENVWNQFLLSPLEAARYVDQFESDRVGWYFDVGNVVNYGWPEQWIRILDDRILKLDVKEFSRKRRDDEGLWKGFGVKLLEGDCDWPAVMAALEEIGYTGWATAEIPGGERAHLAEIAERMDRIFAS